jgi:hypothetical protein
MDYGFDSAQAAPVADKKRFVTSTPAKESR